MLLIISGSVFVSNNKPMSNIRLHPKYGLNPTMPLCIVCGKETGEIALLGASYKEEAPRTMVLGIEPCTPCRKEYLKEGVMLVEADQTYGEMGKKKQHPTGRIMIIKEEAYKDIFSQDIPPRRIAMCERGVLQQLQKDIDEND
jgi:hypothetical protein